MEIQQISRRSYLVRQRLPGWDLNLHVIRATHRNYVIDTGLGAESAAPVKALLQSDGRPTVVINTHHHWDHIWGNHCFDGCLIISHSLCRDLIAEKWDDMLARNGHFACGQVACRLPDLVFDGGLSFPDDGIRLIHTPGHTADSISVFDEADRLLNTGDNIGESADELVPSLSTGKAVYGDTIRSCIALNAALCVSGHNAVQTPDVFAAILASLGPA